MDLIEVLQKAEDALRASRPIKDHSVIPHNNHVEALKAVSDLLNQLEEEEIRASYVDDINSEV